AGHPVLGGRRRHRRRGGGTGQLGLLARADGLGRHDQVPDAGGSASVPGLLGVAPGTGREVRAVAVRDQRARVLHRLPEQRRFVAGGMPTLLAMVLGAIVLFLGGLVVGRATMTGSQAGAVAPATTAAA